VKQWATEFRVVVSHEESAFGVSAKIKEFVPDVRFIGFDQQCNV